MGAWDFHVFFGTKTRQDAGGYFECSAWDLQPTHLNNQNLRWRWNEGGTIDERSGSFGLETCQWVMVIMVIVHYCAAVLVWSPVGFPIGKCIYMLWRVRFPYLFVNVRYKLREACVYFGGNSWNRNFPVFTKRDKSHRINRTRISTPLF